MFNAINKESVSNLRSDFIAFLAYVLLSVGALNHTSAYITLEWLVNIFYDYAWLLYRLFADK